MTAETVEYLHPHNSIYAKWFSESGEGGKHHWHTSSSRCGWCSGEYRVPCVRGCYHSRDEGHEHVYVYLRTSSRKQFRQRTERRQLARVEKLLGKRSSSVLGIWGDHALSVNTPVWQDGLEALLCRVADDPHAQKRLVVADVRRLTRNLEQGRRYLQRANELHIDFETTYRHYDNTKAGRKAFLDAVRAAVYDNFKRSQGNKRSHNQTALAKGWRSTPWLGYERRDGALTPMDTWNTLFKQLEATALHFGFENILADLQSSPAWLTRLKTTSMKQRRKMLRTVFNDPRYAGWKRLTGTNHPKQRDGFETVVEGGWESVFGWDFWVHLQMLYPTNLQLALIPKDAAYLQGKLRCGRCGRLMKVTGLHLLDYNEGEILCGVTAYICPPRRNRATNGVSSCLARVIAPSNDVHAQLDPIFQELARQRNKPRDLAEQWLSATDDDRPAFIASHLKRAVIWQDGQLHLQKR